MAGERREMDDVADQQGPAVYRVRSERMDCPSSALLLSCICHIPVRSVQARLLCLPACLPACLPVCLVSARDGLVPVALPVMRENIPTVCCASPMPLSVSCHRYSHSLRIPAAQGGVTVPTGVWTPPLSVAADQRRISTSSETSAPS